MGAQPDGDPAPADGSLPESALEQVGERPFGVYVHVPWCSSRCGYCDFNTYVPGAIDGAAPNRFAADAITEVMLARSVLGDRDVPVSTVFVGGGTPTLLPARHLTGVLQAIDSEFGLAHNAEVTTEANPESVDPEYFDTLRNGGFTRISLGMQSAVPHVLATLDRIHTPGRALDAARWAFEAGFEEVSLDLIYGTPGESDTDWTTSVDAALSANPTHISAYSLIVEPGTRMARQVANGDLDPPDDDVLAERYELADAAFAAAGLGWYEVSNWSRPGSECLHNMGYWRNENWWGIGPGAHSHVGGVRWWNVKHPARHGAAVRSGQSPAAAREVLTADDRRAEQIMLGIRLVDGLAAEPGGNVKTEYKELDSLQDDGLISSKARSEGRIALTDRGRLLADLVARRLIG